MSTFKHTPGPWTAEGAGRQIHTSSGTFYLDYSIIIYKFRSKILLYYFIKYCR